MLSSLWGMGRSPARRQRGWSTSWVSWLVSFARCGMTLEFVGRECWSPYEWSQVWMMHHDTVVHLPGTVGTHLRSEAMRKGPAAPPRIVSRRRGMTRISWRLEGECGRNEHMPLYIYIWIPTKDHDSPNLYTSGIYIPQSTINVCVIFQHSLFPMIHKLLVLAAVDFFISATIWWLYWIAIWPETHTIYIWWYCEVGKAQNDVFVNSAPPVVFRLLKYSSDFRPLKTINSGESLALLKKA